MIKTVFHWIVAIIAGQLVKDNLPPLHYTSLIKYAKQALTFIRMLPLLILCLLIKYKIIKIELKEKAALAVLVLVGIAVLLYLSDKKAKQLQTAQ